MTFSIAGRCARTGMFGVAISSSSICVAARCPHARAGVGAVSTQNVTDPTYGPRVLDLLATGLDASTALARALEGRRFPEYRQILLVDNAGRTACHSGQKILGTHSVSEGDDCIAAGNMLKSVNVTHRMTQAFNALPTLHLAERLLRALEAGRDAGGEEGPTHSAGLLVAHDQPFPLVDLRCDWADDNPIAVLRRLWTDYEPQMLAYRTRAIDPSEAPSYNVPGDP